MDRFSVLFQKNRPMESYNLRSAQRVKVQEFSLGARAGCWAEGKTRNLQLTSTKYVVQGRETVRGPICSSCHGEYILFTCNQSGNVVNISCTKTFQRLSFSLSMFIFVTISVWQYFLALPPINKNIQLKLNNRLTIMLSLCN